MPSDLVNAFGAAVKPPGLLSPFATPRRRPFRSSETRERMQEPVHRVAQAAQIDGEQPGVMEHVRGGVDVLLPRLLDDLLEPRARRDGGFGGGREWLGHR